MQPAPAEPKFIVDRDASGDAYNIGKKDIERVQYANELVTSKVGITHTLPTSRMTQRRSVSGVVTHAEYRKKGFTFEVCTKGDQTKWPLTGTRHRDAHGWN